MMWDAAFDEPIRLPNGRMARTLKEAARYITKLPPAEHDHPRWRIAVRVLIEAAQGRKPIDFARTGMVQALKRDEKPRLGTRPSA